MPKHMYSNDFIIDVINYYKNHTIRETSIKFNISKKVIERILRNNRIERHKLGIRKFINDEDKQFIINNYNLLSDTAIARELNIHNQHLFEIYKELNLKPRTHEENVKLGQILQQKTCLEKYGVPFTSQAEEIKNKFINSRKETYKKDKDIILQKTKQTCLEKYGCEYSLQSKEVREKGKKTCLEKYGVDCNMKTSSFRNKSKEYLKEHKEEILNKRQKTCLEKYGCKHPAQTKEVQEKIKQQHFKKFGCWISQTKEWKQNQIDNKDEIRKKLEQTCLERYGTKNYCETDEFKRKEYTAKKKNKTFNSSKIEKKFCENLLSIFNEEDIYKQYRDLRYPFACDFYIKPLDLFIELNLHWSHGATPFNKDDKECINQLKKWKLKAIKSKYYQIAIKTWTERDVKNYKLLKKIN